MTLNWRHKTGLFLTLVAVWIGLILEVSAKQAVGIALLGIAFSWLIGSVSSRTLMVTFAIPICAVGLNVAVIPVWGDWSSAKRSAAKYDLAMADLQTTVKRLTFWQCSRAVTIPNSVQSWERPEKDLAAGEWTTVEESFPASMSDAEIMKDFQTNLLLPRPTFAFGSSLRAHVWNVFGGLALFVFGLSVLGWLLLGYISG